MAKKDEIKVGDEVFAEQGFEGADGQFHDVTGIVESIKDGVFKLSSDEYDLSGYDYEIGDLVKKPAVAATKPPVEEKKKTVEVDAEVLSKLVSGFEEMKQKVTDLEGAADLNRLTRIQAARNDGKLVKKAKVNMYSNKPVVGWVAVKDDVFFDEQGKMHEDQQVKLFLFEGAGKKPSETVAMSYREFSRITTRIEGEVIKESKDSEGKVSFTILLPDGLELELPIVFLN